LQITEAKKVLEKALQLSEPLEKHLGSVKEWLSSTDSQMATVRGSNVEIKAFIAGKFKEMTRLKDQVQMIRK
jgi:hypothetical protein